MTEQELIELLADKEHASWARWMEYFFSKCFSYAGFGDELAIPSDYVRALRRLIATPYAELPEHSKQSDRDEVAHILPIIQQYMAIRKRDE